MKYYKICIECGKKLTRSKHFYRNFGAADGFKNICKSCMGIKKGTKTNVLPNEIINLLSYHEYTEVKYFGFFLGYIIRIRKGEYLAYSILKGTHIFPKKNVCKAWLCQRVIKASKIIERGLTKKLKEY